MNEIIVFEARKKFGLLFKELRKEKGLTQTEVADFCGVTFQTINKIENGKFPYSIDLFFKLSVILGFTINLEPKEEGKDDRFILQKGNKEKTYVLTDTTNNIVCVFEYKKFNETQKITFLKESTLSPNNIATIMREIGDYVLKNHPDIV